MLFVCECVFFFQSFLWFCLGFLWDSPFLGCSQSLFARVFSLISMFLMLSNFQGFRSAGTVVHLFFTCFVFYVDEEKNMFLPDLIL